MNTQCLVQGSAMHGLIRTQCVLTASEYASAVNCYDAYESAISLYKRKKEGREKETNHFAEFLMERGNEMEALCKDWINKWWSNWILTCPGFFFYPEDPRFGASPDGMLLDIRTGKQFVLEIKSRSPGFGSKTPPKPIEKVEDIPMKYIIQIMGEMAACKVGNAYLVIYSPDVQAPKVFHVVYNEDLWGSIYDNLCTFARCLAGDQEMDKRNPKLYRSVDLTKFVTLVPINKDF